MSHHRHTLTSSRLCSAHVTRGVHRRLLDRIKRRCRPGERLGTQESLARELRVSTQTVQRALAVLAEQGWVVRTRGIGTFVSTGQPVGVGRGSSSAVGLLSDIDAAVFSYAPFYRDLWVGLAGRLSEAGVLLHTIRRAGEVGWREQEPRLAGVDLSGFAGLAVVGGEWTPSLNRVARTTPVVVTERELASPCPASSVVFDHVSGIRSAVEHLWSLGHRRIGFMGSVYTRGIQEYADPRYDLYVRGMVARGVDPRPSWTTTAWRLSDWPNCVSRWLSSSPGDRPTAILFAGDAWAGLLAFGQRGVRPGRDISVVAVHHIPAWRDWVRMRRGMRTFTEGDAQIVAGLAMDDPDMLSISPTAAWPDSQTLGEMAAGELLARLADPSAKPRRLVAPVLWLPGNTTCAAGA